MRKFILRWNLLWAALHVLQLEALREDLKRDLIIVEEGLRVAEMVEQKAMTQLYTC